jgi:hypothetical protein
VKYDNLLKTIFFDAMPAMLRALDCAPVAEYLSVEFPERPRMVADVVARLADGKILHLEFQLRNDPRMHWRCYHYFGAIQELWEDAEIIQIVIYLGNGPMQMKREIRKPTLGYEYEIVDMRAMEASVFLESPNDAERVLAVLCESTDPRSTIRGVLASWRHLSDKTLLENIGHLKTLSKLRGTGIIAEEEINRMPFDIDMRNLTSYVDGEAALLTRLLESSFGPLPAETRKRVKYASVDEIEGWGIRLLHARDLEDVFADDQSRRND